MLVTVILLNFHSEADIHEAVDSLEQSAMPKDFTRKVLIVDNESTEASWAALQDLKKYSDLELLQSAQNLGFTGGNNLAMRRAQELNSDFFLLLNPDTKADKNFLVELVKPFLETAQYRFLNKEREIGLASPKIYFYPGFEFHKEQYAEADKGRVIWYAGGKIDWDNVVGTHLRVDEVDHGEPAVKQELAEAKLSFASANFVATDFCTGCCLLISKSVVDRIGLLDEKLFFSLEDMDYSVRAKGAGFEAIYVPGSVVWHKNANTSGGAGSPIQDFYHTRNRLIFAFRYTSLKTKILLLWLLLRTADANRLKAIFSALKP